VNHLPLELRYESEAAEIFRSRLREKVRQKVSNNPTALISEEQSPTAHSPSEHLIFEFTFWEGPIGLTLMKDEDSRAVVARLVTNGPAQQKGVCIGDRIESIAGQSFLSYEELMDLILLLPRPVQINFLRPPSASSDLVEQPTTPEEESELNRIMTLVSGADVPLLMESFEGQWIL
jgi:C-terminal processing protease CtpA/Prc